MSITPLKGIEGQFRKEDIKGALVIHSPGRSEDTLKRHLHSSLRLVEAVDPPEELEFPQEPCGRGQEKLKS